MRDIERYIAFIKEAEGLKSVLRTSWTASGRRESTAEHTWRLMLLTVLLLKKFPDLDARAALLTALVHDMGELYEGDISAALLPDENAKLSMERDAISKVFGLLPEDDRALFTKLWEEYNAASTPEARLVKALDKAETIIQHNQGKNPPGFDYAFNLSYGKEYFRDYPLLAELRAALDADTAAHAEAGSDAAEKRPRSETGKEKP